MFIGKSYDFILQGDEATEETARNCALSLVWEEIGETYQSIRYAEYIDTVNAIAIYYDYGADYYFFINATEDL